MKYLFVARKVLFVFTVLFLCYLIWSGIFSVVMSGTQSFWDSRYVRVGDNYVSRSMFGPCSYYSDFKVGDIPVRCLSYFGLKNE